MDWTMISAIADGAAAFGVAGSLIFVGFQVRQNSAGLRYSAVQAQMAAYQGLYTNIIDSGGMAIHLASPPPPIRPRLPEVHG